MTEQLEPIAVVNQLTESLSAVRMALNPQVQELLDDIVNNTKLDVGAHAVSVSAVTVNAALTNEKTAFNLKASANQADDDIEDVQAHAVNAVDRVNATNVITLKYDPQTGYVAVAE